MASSLFRLVICFMRRAHNRFKRSTQHFKDRMLVGPIFLLNLFTAFLFLVLLHQLPFGWQCNDFRCITFFHLFSFFFLVCLIHMAKLILAVSLCYFFVLSVFLVHVSFPMFNFTFAFVDKGVHPKSQFIWENCISPFLEVAINCCVILPVEFGP